MVGVSGFLGLKRSPNSAGSPNCSQLSIPSETEEGASPDSPPGWKFHFNRRIHFAKIVVNRNHWNRQPSVHLSVSQICGLRRLAGKEDAPCPKKMMVVTKVKKLSVPLISKSFRTPSWMSENARPMSTPENKGGKTAAMPVKSRAALYENERYRVSGRFGVSF
jgi:hypothetical protein